MRPVTGRGLLKEVLPQRSDRSISFVVYSHLSWTKKWGADHDVPWYARSAYRLWDTPENRSLQYGFRLARVQSGR